MQIMTPMRSLSAMTQRITGQPMFQLLRMTHEQEARGARVFHFEIGDSDFSVAPPIAQAVKDALDRDQTHYVCSSGIAALKDAIARDTQARLGFRPAPAQIVVMPSNAVIDAVIRCVCDPADEVIGPDPGFSTYAAVTGYTGISQKAVPLSEAAGFCLSPAAISRQIGPRTKLIILNSPSNPTGAVLDQASVAAIVALAEKHGVYLLSDEVYSRLTYDGVRHYSPAVYDHCQERTIILEGFSKAYAMSGFRLGYAIGPEPLMEKINLLFQTVYSCVAPFIQYAGIAALEDAAGLAARSQLYHQRRDHLHRRLNQLPGVSCLKPQGAMYAFANITRTGMRAAEFAEFALRQANVALLPGTCFGAAGEGFVRLCFAKHPETVDAAMDALHTALTQRKNTPVITQGSEVQHV